MKRTTDKPILDKEIEVTMTLEELLIIRAAMAITEVKDTCKDVKRTNNVRVKPEVGYHLFIDLDNLLLDEGYPYGD